MRHRFREADALLLLGSIAAIVGRYAEARRALDETEALAAQLRAPYFEPHIASSRGYVDLLEGDPASAERRYRKALALTEASGDERGQATARAGLARAIVRRSLDESATSHAAGEARRAVELAASQGQAIEAEARLAAMEVAVAREDGEEAREHAHAALELLDALGTQEQFEVEILLAAHHALHLGGDEEGATRALARARARAQARADRIGDPELRASFRAVPHNRTVLRAV